MGSWQRARTLARDIQVFVPFDATASYTAYRHTAALDLISTMSGRVLAVEDLPHAKALR